MTALPWVIVAIESVALIIITVVWLRRAGRTVDTLSELPPPSTPDPAEVKALKDVLQAATLASDHGATTLESLAQAVLGAGYRRQQREEIEALRQAGRRAWDIHHGQRGGTP